jgi:hypothetical protein
MRRGVGWIVAATALLAGYGLLALPSDDPARPATLHTADQRQVDELDEHCLQLVADLAAATL